MSGLSRDMSTARKGLHSPTPDSRNSSNYYYHHTIHRRRHQTRYIDMSRLARASSTRNTAANTPATTSSATPGLSNIWHSYSAIFKTKTDSSISISSIHIKLISPAIARKKSSPAKLNNPNEIRRTTTETETQDQLQPTQDTLPGANIKVVVRCRGLTDAERAADPQVVLLTGGPHPRHPGAHDIHANRDEGAGLANTDYSSSLVDDPKRSANIKVYPFDHVFGPEADQALIFTDVVAPILDGSTPRATTVPSLPMVSPEQAKRDMSIPTATTIMPTTKADSGATSPFHKAMTQPSGRTPTSLRKFTNEADHSSRPTFTLQHARRL
ncbi:hypothetical protein Pst134EA_011794 [Puccinia striiformis f. sp. tritici]|uniref:hypothetical protein n=1 Tax=Puccinia striiformis f. sp. tritici TaxID=168172 RepID=UPI002007A112|nr:hypothetical protein Pst134EA_011794 [Puccinia striiformis f. sp. tritici]KAH9468170.1 hypothetical protein Pst134EA_011794 [Puccinia striiformis f. sp. tritici]